VSVVACGTEKIMLQSKNRLPTVRRFPDKKKKESREVARSDHFG
jgi:hypothetical protein